MMPTDEMMPASRVHIHAARSALDARKHWACAPMPENDARSCEGRLGHKLNAPPSQKTPARLRSEGSAQLSVCMYFVGQIQPALRLILQRISLASHSGTFHSLSLPVSLKTRTLLKIGVFIIIIIIL